MTEISSKKVRYGRGQPDLDLNLVKVLAELIETRSVTRTAERLNISQPTASRALNELRAALDDPLLIKSGKSMSLTPRAEELREPLENMLGGLRHLLKPVSFDPASTDRVFHIATTDFGLGACMMNVISGICSAAPNIHLQFRPLTEDNYRELANGELELVLTGYTPPDTLHSCHLFHETFACVTRRGHPLLAGGIPQKLELEEFLNWPHAAATVLGNGPVDPVDRILADVNRSRHVQITVPYFFSAASLVVRSDVIFTMPARQARQFAEVSSVAVLPAPLELGGFDYWLVWHERTDTDQGAAWLRKQIIEQDF